VSETATTVDSRRRATTTVGMAIFLGAIAMLFAGLFLAYAVVRAQAPAWPPAGDPGLPRGALGVNTAILLAASVALRAARIRLALALGLAFVVAQALVWRALVGAGAGPASGIYGSVFFAISGFHAVHVVGGLIALGVLAVRGRGRVEAVSLYWDFVFVVWLLFYVGACLR
jgi:cytochrome c oxidase subunit III